VSFTLNGERAPQLKACVRRHLIPVSTLTIKIFTVVLGLLTLPFFFGLLSFVFLVSAILLCPDVTAARRVDCQDCGSDWCSIALAVVIFLALPLFIVSAYLFTRRKARNRGPYSP
jgi:hypothetical protein